MAEQFTPGPWHVEDFDTVFSVKSRDGIKIVKTSWHDSIRKPYPLKPEARANARLIASAPALYAACENAATAMRILAEVAEDVRMEGSEPLRERLAELEAALKAARGEA